jgi:3-hydroxybutyryl-CoA dehydrogenase
MDSNTEQRDIQSVTLIGDGFMAAQIGLQYARFGFPVCFVGHLESSMRKLPGTLEKMFDDLVSGKIVDANAHAMIFANIRTTLDMRTGVESAGLVIESVPENLAIKRDVFAKLDALAPPETILASNSSSLRVTAIEDVMTHSWRLMNMHFYPPVWERPMVELMKGTQTTDEAIDRVARCSVRAGLTPLRVLKDSTGLLFNRVWRAVKRETLHLVDEGVASYEDVDRAWMIFTGTKIGPFGLMDIVGLDVVRDIEMVYYRESGTERDAPPKLLLDKLARGELGVKSGRGFYTYPNPAFKDPAWLKRGT